MIFPTRFTTILAASMLLSMAPLPSQAIFGDQLPNPTFVVDFADPDSVDENVKEITAEVLTGPDDVPALRIDECGKHAILPVDINPTAMPEVTLVLGINLVSIAEGSIGWPLSSDNGGYDRSITMHDERFFGMGMPSGFDQPVWEEPEQGVAPLNEWLHVVAVYSQPLDSLTSLGVFYVNGVAAPIQVELFNGGGTSDLAVGTNMLNECRHWTDSWIKEVQIFDSALTASEVEALYEEFLKSLSGISEDDSEDEPGLLEDILDTVSDFADSIIGDSSASVCKLGWLVQGLAMIVPLVALGMEW